jgi:hypothetical protein
VAHGDAQPELVGQTLQFGLPGSRAMAREVVHLHVLRRLRGLPFPAGILEIADQFLLFGVIEILR